KGNMLRAIAGLGAKAATDRQRALDEFRRIAETRENLEVLDESEWMDLVESLTNLVTHEKKQYMTKVGKSAGTATNARGQAGLATSESKVAALGRDVVKIMEAGLMCSHVSHQVYNLFLEHAADEMVTDDGSIFSALLPYAKVSTS
ncbi:hypothetical protein HDU76_009445, partial [Blyttiomyces sp. JEL0837]